MRKRLEAYMIHLQAVKDVSSHTLRAYYNDISAFLDHLETIAGSLPTPDKIKPRWIRRYLGELSAKGIGRATSARKLSSLKGFFRYLVQEGDILSSPAEDLTGVKLDKKLPELPTEKEVDRTFNLIGTCETVEQYRDRALLELLYGSGLRVGEAMSLDIRDIDLKRGWLRVMGKRRKERVVPVGREAVNALQAWLKVRSEWCTPQSGDALFLGKRGKRLDQRVARQVIHSLFENAGIKKGTHPHALRHAFATHMLDHGAGIESVGELLGHASLSTTQIYTHVSVKRLKEVYTSKHPRARKDKQT